MKELMCFAVSVFMIRINHMNTIKKLEIILFTEIVLLLMAVTILLLLFFSL